MPENAEAARALELELIAYCKSQLADVKCPRSIDFRAEHRQPQRGKAKGQAHDQRLRAPRGSAKGWDDIQPDSKCMGKLGAMAVMDHLRSLAKKGNPTPLDHYRNLKGQEKIDFAVQLKVDREAAFMKVVESHSLETSVNNQLGQGVDHRGPSCQGGGVVQLQYMPRAEDLAPDDLG